MDDLSIDPQQAIGKTRVVAFEKAPLVDDGKHWVLLSNGNIERRVIEPALATAHGVIIQARKKPVPEPEIKLASYTIHARLLGDKPAKDRVEKQPER